MIIINASERFLVSFPFLSYFPSSGFHDSKIIPSPCYRPLLPISYDHFCCWASVTFRYITEVSERNLSAIGSHQDFTGDRGTCSPTWFAMALGETVFHVLLPTRTITHTTQLKTLILASVLCYFLSLIHWTTVTAKPGQTHWCSIWHHLSYNTVSYFDNAQAHNLTEVLNTVLLRAPIY
jgi:hypothetical protein